MSCSNVSMAGSPPKIKSGPELNFCLPMKPRLSSDRVLLVPYKTDAHAEPFYNLLCQHPEMMHWLPFHMWDSLEQFKNYFEEGAVQNPTWALFVVFSKPTPASTDESQMEMTGMIALTQTDAASASTEFGAVFTFPKFQRTCVTTHMIGLLLIECLTPAHEGGLGLRRVQWHTSSRNAASRRAAERMGFKLEGTFRWLMVLPRGKEGNGIDVAQHHNLLKGGVKGYEEEFGELGPGRDSFMLALCWDDWLLDGGKELAQRLMDRK